MPVNIFTPNMPLKPNSLGFTQPLVLGNFANYRENMEVNHEDVNSADFGKHKYLTLTKQNSAPATGATESGLYSGQINNLFSVLFLQRESTSAEVGIAMYPGSVAASTFAVYTNIFDFGLIVDATHPNMWAMFEIRDADGIVVNSLVMVKIYKGGSGYASGAVLLADFATGVTGGFPTFRMIGNVLQMILSSPPGAPIALKFTITSFYFPES